MAAAIAILGSGAWGTALAAHCRRQDAEVRQWVREPEVAAQVRGGENRVFLPGVALPEGIDAETRLDRVLDGADWIFAVVPSQYARSVYREIGDLAPADAPWVVAAKGIEEHTLMLPAEVVRDEFGAKRGLAVLSGPSFARDVAGLSPTALVAASDDPELADRLQALLASPEVRVYTNNDPAGVQLGGALKNVMALAAGILDGLGLGPNARAAMITRGLAEMTRLGCRLGGSPATFSGLAGLGDLVLTCTENQSRNFTVGRRLGAGESIERILDGATAVAEGVRTVRSVREIAERERVSMPIVAEVYRILYEGGDPQAAIQRLMARPLISEHEAHETTNR